MRAAAAASAADRSERSPRLSAFWSRIVVAVGLLPVVLGLVWLGGWWIVALGAVAVPVTKPSQVFPGESVGAIRCRPTRRPVKYAAVSAANTAMMTVKAASCPCSGRPRRRIRYPSPRPIQPAPSTVEPTATVAEVRVRATR